MLTVHRRRAHVLRIQKGPADYLVMVEAALAAHDHYPIWVVAPRQQWSDLWITFFRAY